MILTRLFDFTASPVPMDEHIEVIEKLHATDPEKYWTVSVPEEYPGSESFAVQDGHGIIHGYYYVSPHPRGVYLGGLVNSSGIRGVGTLVLRSLRHQGVVLDCYDLPGIAGLYAHHGFGVTQAWPWTDGLTPDAWRPGFPKPGYVDMYRAATP